MGKFDVHVCLVSDQAVPNFVPVLDKEFRPQDVVLLVTERMKVKADVLEKVLRERCGVKVQQLGLADEYDMGSVTEQVFGLLCDVEKERVALNVTGGTKLMAIATYGMFKDAGYPAFYFTANSNEVLLLDDNQRLMLQPPKIKIEDYLALHGYPVRGVLQKQIRQAWFGLAGELVRAYTSLADELAALNYEISLAAEKNRQALVCEMPKARDKHNMAHFLGLLADLGLASEKNGKLVFADMEARQYVGGGWFEDYVFQTAKSLPNVQDIALNVQIENANSHTYQHNELDIVLLVNNVLHVIECKTANFTRPEAKAEEILYKLESLKKLGGLRTRAMLVSYRELLPQSRDRARGADIEVIEQKDLKGMKTLLEKWTHGR